MGRCCADCRNFLSNSNFSSNQWRKGEGGSRCKNCVSGGMQNHHTAYAAVEYQPPPTYTCRVCSRDFNNQNELNMHMQVHRPRDVSCPVCNETRFRSPANAVQHVESGYCTGCVGQDNARQQIYQYAQRQGGMQQYMDLTPLLTYGGGNTGVPDLPYHCRECNKSYRHLSQLMQHKDQKHNNMRMLGY